MKRYFLAVASLLVFFSNLNAQQVTVKGRVVDSSTGKPLSDVQVFNKTSKNWSLSAATGDFSVTIFENESVQLVFSKLSFEPFEREISAKDTGKEILVSLIPKAEQLEEVEILGVSAKEQFYQTEYLDIKQLEQSNLQDVGDLLRSVPNVSGVKKGAMGVDPVIRGFKYSQLNVQLNGGAKIEGGCPNRMDPVTSHVDISDLKNIVVLKGPFALKYGVNFGGVIDLETYQPVFYQQYKTNVSVLLGAQTNHFGAKTKVGISGANRFVNYDVSGSWKKYGDYQDGNENWVPASLQQQALVANIGFKINEKHTVSASTDFSQGENIDFPTLPMDERKDDTKLYGLNYRSAKLGNSINFIRAKAYYSDVNHTMDNKNRPSSDTVVAVSEIHAVASGGKAGINFNLGEAKIELGGDYENIYKDGTRLKTLIMQPMLPEKEEDLWNDAHISNTGIFAEYQRLGEEIDYILAARLDFNEARSGSLISTTMGGEPAYKNDSTTSSFVNFSFSGGIEWHISKASDLMFSFGRGVRSPDMTERFIILLPTGYDPYDYLGNPQLQPEVNNEFDLDYHFSGTHVGKLEVSTFFSIVSNYISTELVPPSEVKPQTKGVLGVKRFINVDQAYLSGFEVTYNTPSKFTWLVSVNMAYTMGWNPEAIGQILENGKVVGEKTITNDPLPEIPPFKTNITFSYPLFQQKFVPSISLVLAAAQNRVSEAYNEKTTPGFTVLNLDFKYQFNQNLKVFAGVKNLFNAAYYEHLNRNIIGSQNALYEPGIVFYANLIFNF